MRSARSAGPASLVICFLALLALAPSARAASGDLAWQRFYDGVDNGADQFTALAPAPNGGVYAAGFTMTTTAGADVLVARYDAAGQRNWVRTYSGPASLDDSVSDVATDRHGNLVGVGAFNTANVGVIKYGPGGQRRWARVYDDPASAAEMATDVALDDAGNVYVAGSRSTAATGNDTLLVKYSPAGKRLWVRTYAGPGMAMDQSTDVATDHAGNVYLTGYGENDASGYDVLTIKYDRAGHRRWLRY
jgi:hypothetical protein